MRLLVSTLAALLLASCGLITRSQRLFGGTLPVAFTISAGANSGNPVAVNVVVVYDKRLLDKLLALSAQEWFKGREQWQRDYGDELEVEGWEWVPGQAVPRQEIAFHAGAKAGLIFADYYAPGAHRALIDPQQSWRVELLDSSLRAEPLKE